MEYETKEISRPEFWGGLWSNPSKLNFGRVGPIGFMTVFVIQLQADFSWKIERLSP